MSKVKLLLDVVSDMRSLADSLAAVADAMSDSQEAIHTEKPQIPETDAEPQKLTLEDVRTVLAEKSANGHSAEIRKLLSKYGKTRLSEIEPKDYPALLADAEVL